MKKLRFTITAILLLIALISCSGTANEQEQISRRLGVSVEGGTVAVYTDDHGGVHGDGETYAEFVFSDDSFYGEIKNNIEWSPLPLTQNLNTFVYGGTLSNGASWVVSIKDEQGQPLIPTVADGYYFFKDRHDGTKDPKDDSLIFDRSSMNLR